MPYLSRHGTPIGVFCFSRNQNNCMYCCLSLKISTHEMLHGAQRSWMHFVYVRFRLCGRKTQPPIATPWLTTPSHRLYRSSGISFLYLWLYCMYFTSSANMNTKNSLCVSRMVVNYNGQKLSSENP